MKSSYPSFVSERLPLQDHCGIVAAFAPKDFEFFKTGLAGLSILQTRGYDGAGFCAKNENGQLFEHKDKGMVREVFRPLIAKDLNIIRAKSWVYQVRYGTSGEFSSNNVQPIIAKLGQTSETFVIAHNGQFSQNANTKQSGQSDTLRFAHELSDAGGQSWDERIVRVLSTKRGAWSLVVSTDNALYVARDSWGLRPFVYGHLWDNATRQFIWVAASETSALDAMGITDYFELMPGTIAKISDTGLSILAKQHERQRALCIFENVYLQHGAGKAHMPRNSIRAIKRSPTIDDVRRRCGKILAREAPISLREVNMVIGVPGTGIEGGMTYARTLDLPYFQAITDKSVSLTEQRTFMTADIDSIYHKVLEHFCFDAQALHGRRVVLVDDSIVRGNITRGLIHLLKHYYGVIDVHVRIVSPPIDKACHLGVNTRSSHELIAARLNGNIEKIRIDLDATSLAYLSADGLREAITGDPKARGFCMGCMMGHEPPVDTYGVTIRKRREKQVNKQKFVSDILPHDTITVTPPMGASVI